MTTAAFLLVLVAAALHAGWNALVKGSEDKVLGMVAIAAAGVVIAAVLLPIVPPVAAASWPFLLASAAVHVVYFALVAAAYGKVDMSQAYPLMRGTAPLLVALFGAVLLGEPLTIPAILGILTVCLGVLAMAAKVPRGAGAMLAFANAGVIAGYTLLDGEGVRLSGAPVAYVLWVFGLSGLPFAALVLSVRRPNMGVYLRERWAQGLAGGAATLTAYMLVLWAMTRAPIAIVAALRESAILFGLAISALWLGERVGRARMLQAGTIVAGIVILRLA